MPLGCLVAMFWLALMQDPAASCGEAVEREIAVNGGRVSPICTLTVTNPLDIAVHQAPLSWSIPMAPESGVTDPRNLRLFRGDREVALQCLPLARWGGPPDDTHTPIAWLLIDLLVDLEPRETAVFTLQQGPRTDPTSPLRILRDDASGITIDTGAAMYALSRATFRFFDSVTLSDGTAFPGGGGIRLSGEPSAQRADIEVEHHGINRVSLWVHGIIDQDLEFTARLHFFRGRAEVCVDFRLENLATVQLDGSGQPNANDYGCPNSIAFDDLSLVFRSNLPHTYLLPEGERGSAGVSAGTFEDRLILIQESSGDAHWDALCHAAPRLQSGVTKRASTRIVDATIQDGPNQLAAWFDACGITCAVEGLWQNFPKALRASSDGIEIGLFPGEYALHHELRPGEFKTHTLWIRHHAPGASDVADRAMASTTRFRLLPSVLSMAHSGALGPFSPRLDASFPAYETGTDTQIWESPQWREEYEGRTILDAISIAQHYCWVDYGDIPSDFEMIESPFNLKYDAVRGLVLQAIRNASLDENSRIWWALADAAARHAADIDMLHSRTRGRNQPRAWYEGGMYGHGYHDEDGRTNPHRNRMNPNPSMSGPVSGMFLYGLISGDTLLLDSAMELSDNIVWRTVNTDYWESPQCAQSSGLTQCTETCEGYMDLDYGRSLGHALKAMAGGFLVTGDPQYLTDMEAVAAFQHCREGTGEPRDCDRFNIETIFMRNLGYYLQLRALLGLQQDADALAVLQARVNLMMNDLLVDGAFEICYESPDRYVIHDNWLLAIADGFAIGAEFLDQPNLLDPYGLAMFLDGSQNQFYEGSALSYHSAKEFVNQVGFGNFFLDAWCDHHPPDPHRVTVTASEGGAVTPSGVVQVAHGDDLVVRVTAQSGHRLAEMIQDGQPIPGGPDFAVVNVLEDHTLEARFEPAGDARMAFVPHIPADPNWRARVIIDNAGSTTCQVGFTLFGGGQGVEEIDVTVPVGASRVIDLDEGVCGRVTYRGDRVFLRQALVHLVQAGVAEFELNDQAATTLAFLLPRYQRAVLTWMGLALMNPGDQTASATMRAVGSDGGVLASADIQVPPRDRLVGLVETFFAGLDPWSVSHIEVDADQPLCGINLSGQANQRLLFTRAVAPNALPERVWLPHVATAWDTWDNFLIFDSFDQATTIDVHLYAAGSLVLTQSIELDAQANEVIELNAFRDLGIENGVVELNGGRIAVRSGFRNSAQGGTAEFLLQDQSGNHLVFLFPGYAQATLNWMGLALANCADRETTVTLTAFAGGTVTGSAAMTLDARQRLVGLIEDLIPELGPGAVDRIEVTDSVDLFGINISGYNQERLLFMPAFLAE